MKMKNYFLLIVLMIISLDAGTKQGEFDKPLAPDVSSKKVAQSPKISAKSIASKKEEIAAKDRAQEFKIDVNTKQKNIVALVKRAIDVLLVSRPELAFDRFINDRSFVEGDVSLFVFDIKGTVYVQGDSIYSIWDNFKNYRNAHGVKVADLLIEKANKGGGWVEYEWQNGHKTSYVEKMEKNGVTYIIGAGWYPESKRHSVENLVKNAVAYFYKQGKDQAFHEFSNKVGNFVQGDLYIYVYDSNGYCLAHGDNTALIGRNLSTLKDDNGVLLIPALIKAADDNVGWVSYQWKNAPKIGYVEKVSNDSGSYIIGSGYYPEASRSTVISLVKRGVKYFNAWGKERAAAQFSYKIGEFVYGDLALFMYDFEGVVIGQGDNPELVGQNLYDLRSVDGQYVIRNLIDILKTERSGWTSYEWKHDLAVAYVEKVSANKVDYLIGCAFYPGTKREGVIRLVKKAQGYLASHSKGESMRTFSRLEGGFLVGGLEIFVFNLQGDCLVYGNNYDLIWKNFNRFKDMQGQDVFKTLLRKAENGGGWVQYKSKNSAKIAYVEKIEKDGEFYIIGSAFYK
jgi:signal transduction histidine kinase